MDFHHQPSVLPSNAPSHYDLGVLDSPVPGRVLQERSRNRQSEYPEEVFYAGYKNGLAGYSENPYHPASHHQREDEEEELRKKHDAEQLWRRLMAAPAFCKYRGKIPKGQTTEVKQKWPEHMEQAFCRGLVEYPPRGRIKEFDEDKQQGRNEQIAAYIEKVTGEKRCRKQISSHIQVIKPMVRHDRFIMRWLHTTAERELATDRQQSSQSRHRSSVSMSHRHSVVAAHRKQHLHHPQPSSLASQMIDSFLPPLKEQQSFEESDSGKFIPQLFDMYAGVTVTDAQGKKSVRPFHTFTMFGDTPGHPDVRVESDKTRWYWQSKFPRLVELAEQSVLMCQTILCDATLALLPQEIPTDAAIHIHFEVDTPSYVARLESLRCRTIFYEDGVLVEQKDPNDIEIAIEKDSSRCQLAFGSRFWAARTVAWQKTLRDAPPQERQKAEGEVRDSLKRLTAVQEVYCGSEGSECHPLLVICWKFGQADTHGETTWRHLIFSNGYDPKFDLEAPASQPFDHTTANYPHGTTQAHDIFEPGPFDLGVMTSASLDDLHADLDPVSAGAEMYSAHAFDFNGGHIQICLDNSVPIEAYADPTQGFEQYHSEPRPGADWNTPYPNIFDQSAYGSQAFEQPVDAGAEDGILGQTDFTLSPVVQVRPGS